MDPENPQNPAPSAPAETPPPQEPAALSPLEAMDKGIAEATASEQPDAPDASAQPAAADVPPPPAEVIPGTVPEPPAQPAAAPPAAPESDEITAEISRLGLKEASAARFRELAEERKTYAPMREALEKAGVKDPAEIPRLFERAKVGEDMVKMVMETGASADQYTKTLDYLGLLGRMGRGDVASAQKAWDLLQGEMQSLAQILGREAPGHDPLAGHRDLSDAVASGEITRERALEVAQLRAQHAVQGQGMRLQQESQAAQVAEVQGRTWLQQFDATMTANDPTYAAKRPMLNALVANIRQTLPPQQWPQAVQAAYASIPAFPAAAPVAPAAPAPSAAQPAKPPPGPMRPGGPTPNMTPQFKSPMEAMEYGIQHAGD